MSVENSVDRIIELVSDSHEAVKAKGGTTSTPYLLANLPDAIESIPKGITPSGTKTITENGTHDVTNYASAEVNVAGSGGEDVTAEVETYTSKLAEMETAITALEEELEGKAAGGVAVEKCIVNIQYGSMEPATVTYTDGNLQLKSEEIIRTPVFGYNITVAKNTIMNCSDTFHLVSIEGESYLTNDGYSVVILDDCEVIVGVE